MRKTLNRKILIVFLLLFLLSPQFAHAFSLSQTAAAAKAIAACGLNGPVTCAVFGLTVVVSYIGSALITLMAFFSQVALNLSLNIVNSPTVQTGFKDVLVLANLGFVLGIILIAISTIFRQENYGIKKVLWKLVVMAVLVNFGLVVCGTILNLSDQFTQYFMNQGSPTIGANYNDFTLKFVEAVAPSSLLQPPKLGDVNLGVDQFLTMTTGLLFVIVFQFMVALAFGVLAIMLLLRYVWLSILLIVLPAAWIAWIFPGTQQYWTKWWNHFIKWVFFAPILMFFVYLAMALSVGNITGSTKYLNDATGINNSSVAALSKNVQSLTGNNVSVVNSMAGKLIVLALLFGGFFAASSIGTVGAGMIMNGAKSAGKWAAGATGRKGIQAGTSVFRRKNAEGKSVAERTRTWAQNIKNPVGRYAAGWVARGTTRLETAGTENLVKDYEKKYAGMSANDKQAALLTSLPGPARVALLKSLAKDKKMSGVSADMVLNDDTKNMMANFGQGTEFGNIEKQMMMSKEMYKAIKDGNKDGADAAAEKFFQRFSKKDVADMQFNDVFSGKAKFGQSAEELAEASRLIARGLVTGNPALVANIIPKLKGEVGARFEKIYMEEAQSETARLEKSIDKLGSLDERSQENIRKVGEINKARDDFEKMWARNAVFAGGEEPETKTDAKADVPKPDKAAA